MADDCSLSRAVADLPYEEWSNYFLELPQQPPQEPPQQHPPPQEPPQQLPPPQHPPQQHPPPQHPPQQQPLTQSRPALARSVIAIGSSSSGGLVVPESELPQQPPQQHPPQQHPPPQEPLQQLPPPQHPPQQHPRPQHPPQQQPLTQSRSALARSVIAIGSSSSGGLVVPESIAWRKISGVEVFAEEHPGATPEEIVSLWGNTSRAVREFYDNRAMEREIIFSRYITVKKLPEKFKGEHPEMSTYSLQDVKTLAAFMWKKLSEEQLAEMQKEKEARESLVMLSLENDSANK